MLTLAVQNEKICSAIKQMNIVTVIETDDFGAL